MFLAVYKIIVLLSNRHDFWLVKISEKPTLCQQVAAIESDSFLLDVNMCYNHHHLGHNKGDDLMPCFTLILM